MPKKQEDTGHCINCSSVRRPVKWVARGKFSNGTTKTKYVCDKCKNKLQQSSKLSQVTWMFTRYGK